MKFHLPTNHNDTRVDDPAFDEPEMENIEQSAMENECTWFSALEDYFTDAAAHARGQQEISCNVSVGKNGIDLLISGHHVPRPA